MAFQNKCAHGSRSAEPDWVSKADRPAREADCHRVGDNLGEIPLRFSQRGEPKSLSLVVRK
jgi:hypothetical protein